MSEGLSGRCDEKFGSGPPGGGDCDACVKAGRCLAAVHRHQEERRLAKFRDTENVKAGMYFGEFNGEELNEAHRIAKDAVAKYGDLEGDELQRFLAHPWNDHCSVQAALFALHSPLRDKPKDIILFCPDCGFQHIDAPDISPNSTWTNPPHRSHLCHGCGCIWRPGDFPTNGVAEIATRGKHDSTRQRGRAPAVSRETQRLTALVEKHLQSESPRIIRLKRDLLRRMRDPREG